MRRFSAQQPLNWFQHRNTDRSCLCTFIPATYCIVIFTLLAMSVLEAMLVMFLLDFQDFSCCKKIQSCRNVEVEIQLRPKNLQGNLFLLLLTLLLRLLLLH